MRDRAWRIARQAWKRGKGGLGEAAEIQTDSWATHGRTDRDIHGPSLDSRSLTRASKGPKPFTYMWVHPHTYSRSSFTTSTQRESVKEVAEADLG